MLRAGGDVLREDLRHPRQVEDADPVAILIVSRAPAERSDLMPARDLGTRGK
jgi:hypothetical protein